MLCDLPGFGLRVFKTGQCSYLFFSICHETSNSLNKGTSACRQRMASGRINQPDFPVQIKILKPYLADFRIAKARGCHGNAKPGADHRHCSVIICGFNSKIGPYAALREIPAGGRQHLAMAADNHGVLG